MRYRGNFEKNIWTYFDCYTVLFSKIFCINCKISSIFKHRKIETKYPILYNKSSKNVIKFLIHLLKKLNSLPSNYKPYNLISRKVLTKFWQKLLHNWRMELNWFSTHNAGWISSICICYFCEMIFLVMTAIKTRYRTN